MNIYYTLLMPKRSAPQIWKRISAADVLTNLVALPFVIYFLGKLEQLD